MQRAFAAETLPPPPVPVDLAARLEMIDRFLFATPGGEVRPYALGAFTAPIRAGRTTENYAVVGADGHGTNSWALHYYVVEGPLALFIQLPWGGAYGDAEADRTAIATAFRWARGMQSGVRQARDDGKIPAGWRLLAVLSGFEASGWGWVPAPAGSNQIWHADGNVVLESARAVVDLIKGESRLDA
jgi:hypothetical protein